MSSVLVLGEFHRLVLFRAGPAIARSALGALLADPMNEWLDVPVSTVSAAASAWMDRFRDQPFSLTDAVSFELMTREKLTRAFAFDRHFVTAGFKPLA